MLLVRCWQSWWKRHRPLWRMVKRDSPLNWSKTSRSGDLNTRGLHRFALMPANLITLAHFSVSSAMELAEFSRAAAMDDGTHTVEPRSDLCVDKRPLVELVHDFDGCSVPRKRLVARNRLGNGRNVRKHG